MKKRTIKSLELNKKIISAIETAEAQGGFYFPWTVNTYSIGVTVANAIDAAADYFGD